MLSFTLKWFYLHLNATNISSEELGMCFCFAMSCLVCAIHIYTEKKETSQNESLIFVL